MIRDHRNYVRAKIARRATRTPFRTKPASPAFRDLLRKGKRRSQSRLALQGEEKSVAIGDAGFRREKGADASNLRLDAACFVDRVPS